MLRLAIIGIGNSGANLLAPLRIPGQRFLLGVSANLACSGVQALPAKKLPLLACNYDCIFVAGDPCEPDFDPLVRDLSLYLSERISFLGVFLIRAQDSLAYSESLCSIARYANCCFQYENNQGLRGASLDLNRIMSLFLNADSGNYACVDLAEAGALFPKNLNAFICSATAFGKFRSMQAPRNLTDKIVACRVRKITRSLLHISFPREAAFNELASCCNYLERQCQLGGWLFRDSKTPNPCFRIDIVCASPVENQKD